MEAGPATNKFKKNYVTWNNSERHLLINKRVEMDILFTGKNANSNEGWRKIAADLQCNLPNEKDAIACKTQWNALIKKYKSFFKYHTGEGTGEEAVLEEATDWEFFDKIHAYAHKKDNYHPPFLIDSTDSTDGMLRMEPKCSKDKSLEPSPIKYYEEASSSSSSTPPGSSKVRNEFSRLEQHIKKRDKKIEKKLSSLLSVFGQMVQADYPHIDTSGLLVSSDSESE